MQSKKDKIEFWVKWLALLPAAAMIIAGWSYFLPRMGMKVLRYALIKFLSLAFLGLSLIVVSVESLIRGEQENTTDGRPQQKTLEEIYESRGDHTGLVGIILLVGGIALLLYGGSKVVGCIQDMRSGPVRITLESTQIGNIAKVEEGIEVFSYDLYGTANGEVFKFRIYAEETDESLMRRTNYLAPEVTVIYYPKTKAIVQMQILFEENDKVVLPYDERAYDSRTLEKLPVGQSDGMPDEEEYEEYKEKLSGPTSAPAQEVYVPMKQEYSEVDLEDLGLPEIAIGDNYVEVSKELMALPEGECYESGLLNSVLNSDEYLQKLKGVISEYGVTGTQGCDILCNDDIELILIYNSETYAIEAVYARRCLN